MNAMCLYGWHRVTLMKAVVEGRELSDREWERMADANSRGWMFPETVRLFCYRCDRPTRHAPRKERTWLAI